MPDFFTTIKDIAPWVAIVLSIAAITLSTLTYRRDRAILKATSHYSLDWEGFHACLRIKIVNAGRRPIILSSWGGSETRRDQFWRKKLVRWYGTNFEPPGGLTLGERQTHTFQLEADETLDMLPDGEVIVFDDMWVEDTIGNRYRIKNARENIEKLRNWKAAQSPSRVIG